MVVVDPPSIRQISENLEHVSGITFSNDSRSFICGVL